MKKRLLNVKEKSEKGHHKLKKELGLIEVFSIAAGAMISSGLFVLPAVAFGYTGPSVILSYFLAGILVIPAMMTKAELATAMPKSGGTYFFVQRSLGPLFGTFSGFTNWISLALKSAFALVGIGIFLRPLVPGATEMHVKLIAVGFTLIFMLLNIVSVKESGRFQVVLVMMLIGILLFYIFRGIKFVKIDNFVPFKPNGTFPIFTAAGMIFISFGGLTKIASVASEVKKPGRNIPFGMFSAFAVVMILYVASIFVTVGVLDGELLKKTLTPLSDGGEAIAGKTGYIILAIAAMASFITTANAGIMASSRTPMAMAEDKLLPQILGKVSHKFNTPVLSIVITSMFMIAAIMFLDVAKLAKAASAMMMVLFAFDCIAVILMRESKLMTYKPLYKVPFYPYLQIIGIILYFLLIVQMGTIPVVITAAFFLLSSFWYFFFSRKKIKEVSAFIHVVERITNKKMKSNKLADELRDILIERDSIEEDRFDQLIKSAEIIDIKEESITRERVFEIISDVFSHRLDISPKEIFTLLSAREIDSSTVLTDGLAVPHLVIDGKGKFDLVVLRIKNGVNFEEDKKPVKIIFALAGTIDERNFHLQALMAIAQIVQNHDFISSWNKAQSINDLRNLILLADRTRIQRLL